MLQINPQNQLTMDDNSAFNMIEAELNYFYDKFEKMDILREKFPIIQKALRAGCALARSENAAKMQPRSARECR